MFGASSISSKDLKTFPQGGGFLLKQEEANLTNFMAFVLRSQSFRRLSKFTEIVVSSKATL